MIDISTLMLSFIKLTLMVFFVRMLCEWLFGFDIFASSYRAGEKVGDKITTVIKKRRKKKSKSKTKTRIRISESKVFHINSTDGRSKIVQAVDEEKALAIAAQALAIDESELVAQEVYDKVLR